MESFLSQAAAVVEVLGAGYIAGSFAVYAHHRLNQATHWKARTTFTPVEQVTQVTQTDAPAKRKPTPVELLRQQCQKAGIKWRNAHGKNKHLKKAEMIEALQQLERSKRIATPQPQVIRPASAQKRAA